MSAAPAITYLDVEQGTPEWIEARRGLLTASEMCRIIAPRPKHDNRIKNNGEPYKQREWDPVASNDLCRAHAFEIAAQRITRHVEPHYIGDAMLRGQDDEIYARDYYAEHYAPVREIGFVLRDFGRFRIGYSPDGLVGDDGLIECKSRRQAFQVQTIFGGAMPDEYMIQVQTGLLVSGRKWLDFVSYSSGMPMAVYRVFPDREVQTAILLAAERFEERVVDIIDQYAREVQSRRFVATERRVEMEMVV